ncbi:hypothetical protein BP5796_09290 [Coleophoma crateriformis]|uniref:SET domain-containing protein n=1 Tax=Coleophoma crateriformis TaxID=565419 RepID=A0A3D8R3K1_9HELO|nr:hypothetical protein BP5796_09290 [Coleophoma crateriformis]
MSIHQPHQNTIGTALDLVGSLINHSCDPNAFIFFEQSQLRVRSLRPITAGEEIAQTYVDSRLGVMMRQKILKSDYFFTCECEYRTDFSFTWLSKEKFLGGSRCQEELRDCQAWASKENISVHVFADTENEILQCLNRVIKDRNTSGTRKALEQIEADFSLLTTRVFPKQDWPDTLWPMNDVKLLLAKLYKDNENHQQAVIYALKGCLGFTRRSGPEWDDTLFELLQFIALLVIPERKGISAKPSSFPGDQQLWDFFHGLLHQLLLQSEKTFGLDTAYTKAIITWHANAERSAGRPLPGETGFSKRFDKAQSVILSWAEIDMSRKIVLTG